MFLLHCPRCWGVTLHTDDTDGTKCRWCGWHGRPPHGYTVRDPEAVRQFVAKDLRPVLVDPGLRKVVVQGPPGGASRQGEEREIALDVRPCTRYYLVAVKPDRLSLDFEIRVDYQEPVGGCTPPSRS